MNTTLYRAGGVAAVALVAHRRPEVCAAKPGSCPSARAIAGGPTPAVFGKGRGPNCLFIVNPGARGGRTRRVLERLRVLLNGAGFSPRVEVCEGLDHARAISLEANRAGFETVVAVGGDGTINRVVNGFYNPDGSRVHPGTRLGAIHIGTSPDFHRSYGLPLHADGAVQTIFRGNVREVFVGRVQYVAVPGGGKPQPRSDSGVFTCCANIGLGASLARLANGGIRKYVGDSLGTFLCLLRVLRSHPPRRVRVDMDGACRELNDVLNVTVGKTRYIASGIQVRNRLEAGQGSGARAQELYVVCLRKFSWRQLVSVLWSLYSGRPFLSVPALSLDYGRQIRVESADSSPKPELELELEFDGDPAGWCPCEISTAPEPLELLVPQIK